MSNRISRFHGCLVRLLPACFWIAQTFNGYKPASNPNISTDATNFILKKCKGVFSCFLLREVSGSFPAAVFCCCKLQRGFLRLFFAAAVCSELSCGCFLLLQVAARFPAAVFCCYKLQRGFLRLFFIVAGCSELSCGCFLQLQVAGWFPAAVFWCCKLQRGFLRLFFVAAGCSEVSCDCFLLLQVAARFHLWMKLSRNEKAIDAESYIASA